MFVLFSEHLCLSSCRALFSRPVSQYLCLPLEKQGLALECQGEDGGLLAFGKGLWVHGSLFFGRPPKTQGHTTKKRPCCPQFLSPEGCPFALC